MPFKKHQYFVAFTSTEQYKETVFFRVGRMLCVAVTNDLCSFSDLPSVFQNVFKAVYLDPETQQIKFSEREIRAKQTTLSQSCGQHPQPSCPALSPCGSGAMRPALPGAPPAHGVRCQAASFWGWDLPSAHSPYGLREQARGCLPRARESAGASSQSGFLGNGCLSC